MTPEKFGRYEIKRVLGRGGMSVVYLGFDPPPLSREVAIKVLPGHLIHDPDFKAQLEQEVQTVTKLDHPYIVAIYDYGIDHDQPYVVMPYMHGGTLTARLHQKPLTPAELSQIMGRLAAALAEAHSHNIIHRDIKPGNILFDKRGDAFLADFGISKAVENSISKSGSTSIGTAAYMSPEQGRGAKEIDGRSDIYSLGVVIFEALTQQKPFQADTPVALGLKHLIEPIPSIQAINPDLPADYEIVIRQSMAKVPSERYASPLDLAEDLEKIARGERIQPRPELLPDFTGKVEPPPVEPEEVAGDQNLSPRRLTRSKPLLWAIGGLFLLALIFVGLNWPGAAGTPNSATPGNAANAGSPPSATVTSSPSPPPSATPNEGATTEALMAAIFATQTAAVLSPTNTLPPSDTPIPLPPTATLLPVTPTSSPTAPPTNTPAPLPPIDTPTPTAVPLPGGLFSLSAQVAGRFQTFVYDLDLSRSTPLFSHDGVTDADIQPGAQRLAYRWADQGRGGIYRMDLDGANQVMLTNYVEDRAPNWSADGTGIFFSSTRQGGSDVHRVHRINADGSGELRMPTVGRDPVELGGGQLLFAGWLSYDVGACGIIYYQWRRTSGAGDIVGTEGRVSDQCSDFRPDAVGNQVAFMRITNNQSDIWRNIVGFDVQGSATNITPNTPASNEVLPVFSPNGGEWLAYASDAGGSWGVYVIRADGSTEAAPLIEAPAGANFSDWSSARLSWAN